MHLMILPVIMDGVCLLAMSVITLMTVETTVTNRAAVCIEYFILNSFHTTVYSRSRICV